MSDTPETDLAAVWRGLAGDRFVEVRFARRLERERDEARQQAKELERENAELRAALNALFPENPTP